MNANEELDAIFDADRKARAAEARLLDAPKRALVEVLGRAVSDALALADPAEGELRLRRLADLCAQVPGPEMADALLDILDHEEPGVRVEAGEALLSVAYERFKEVALAVERRLEAKHDGVSMQELPFILTEIRDPDPMGLVCRFLAHPSPEVVGATIEALAAFGDPSAVEALEAYLKDDRVVTLDELDDGPTTIGELAQAAIDELEP